MRTSGALLFASSGYVSAVDEANCAGCGRCAEACPFGALSLAGERVARDWQKCMGCGVCTGQCPQQVFSLSEERNKGVPFEVRLLG